MFLDLNKIQGVGIGLPVVKEAAERGGGNAGVTSEPGRGGTLWVELRASGEYLGKDAAD